MKLILVTISVVFFMSSCKEKQRHWGKYVENDHIGLDNYWRVVTGYDSLQITVNYAGDKLNYNFCYPNEFRKYGKDTIYIATSKDYILDSTGAVILGLIPKFVPKKRKREKNKTDVKYNIVPDTIYVSTPLYIDSTSIPGKRILKMMK